MEERIVQELVPDELKPIRELRLVPAGEPVLERELDELPVDRVLPGKELEVEDNVDGKVVVASEQTFKPTKGSTATFVDGIEQVLNRVQVTVSGTVGV